MRVNFLLVLIYLLIGASLCYADSPATKVDPVGIVLVLVFYLIVVAVGVWASRKQKSNDAEDWVLAGRDIGGVIGVITMVSTWVCGGYLYGTTQSVVTEGSGLAWAQAPWGFSICFWVGGLIFVKPMREKNYVTMLDPIQQKFGSVMTALLYLPTILGDVFWIGMGLATLGACLSVLIGMPVIWAVIISAIFSAFYAFIGGLYSVAYTDVIQLAMMLVCLYLCLPFVITSKLVGDVASMKHVWLGTIERESAGLWVDYTFLLAMGGIPWQVYFQRVLACRSVRDAQILSFWSGLGAFVCAVPAAVMGIYATSVDWSKVPAVGTLQGNEGAALSYILKYMTPKVVGYIGLGGIAAATVSTADGAFLASSTVFSLNVYKPLFRPKASGREIVIVSRIGVFVIATIGVVLALTVQSIYGLWVLTSDFIYVLLFPQLLLILYYPRFNVYGALVGYVLGLLIRVGAGEAYFGLKPFLNLHPQIPSRTMAMLLNMLCCFLFSELSYFLMVTKKWAYLDFWRYFESPLGPRSINAENEKMVAVPAEGEADGKKKEEKKEEEGEEEGLEGGISDKGTVVDALPLSEATPMIKG